MGSFVDVIAREQWKAFVQYERIVEKQKSKLLLDRRWTQQRGKKNLNSLHVRCERLGKDDDFAEI